MLVIFFVWVFTVLVYKFFVCMVGRFLVGLVLEFRVGLSGFYFRVFFILVVYVYVFKGSF